MPLRKDQGKDSCEETGGEQGSTAGNSSQPTASAALEGQGFKFSKKRRYAQVTTLASDPLPSKRPLLNQQVTIHSIAEQIKQIQKPKEVSLAEHQIQRGDASAVFKGILQCRKWQAPCFCSQGGGASKSRGACEVCDGARVLTAEGVNRILEHIVGAKKFKGDGLWT